jgi:hypothetical protein
MSNGEIDRLQVNQLSARYGDLARSAVYTRLDALNIKPKKVGNRAYINARQLKQLDELHQFIQAGGTTAEFLEMRGTQPPQKDDSQSSSGLSIGQSDLMQFLANLLPRLQSQAAEPDPLAYFEKLEQAAQNGWQLSTTEVSYLVKLPVSEIQQYGDRFYEAGFVFTRAGFRAKGEVAWKVSKA